MRRTKGYAKNNYETLRKEIRSIYEEHYKSYGYRRITALLKERGYPVNHKLVYRLMREENIKCLQRKKSNNHPKDFVTYSESFGKKCADLLKREFSTFRFGEKWATDMTKITINSGTSIYLTVVIDLYNSEVVGYSLSQKANLKAVFEAVNYAHMRYPKVHPILHSDRGWFYCTDNYISLLERFGYERSMSSTGSCYDNAVVESFFAQLKTELVFARQWK